MFRKVPASRGLTRLVPRSRIPPCLRAALTVLLTGMIALALITIEVRWRWPVHLERAALRMRTIKLTGVTLQRIAFERTDVLPVYGSSELDRPAENRPDLFFRDRPTGFSVFPVGRAGNSCLAILGKLAATGSVVRGKKVVIFLSPTWFLRDSRTNAVEDDFSPTQLSTWICGHDLSHRLKHDLACRLLQDARALRGQPLLATSLECLAKGRRADRVELALLYPLDRLQQFALCQIETWLLWRDLPTLFPNRRQRRQRGRLPPAGSVSTGMNWQMLAAQAETRDRAEGDGSLYCVGPPTPGEDRRHARSGQRATATLATTPGAEDASFGRKLAASTEWGDLALLLRGLRELGVETLVVSQPFNGVYQDELGNSATARRRHQARRRPARALPGGPRQLGAAGRQGVPRLRHPGHRTQVHRTIQRPASWTRWACARATRPRAARWRRSWACPSETCSPRWP